MAYKIMLDAGHGGSDPGAVYQGRQEKDDTLKLAMEVGQILERNGIDVLYTRTNDIYQTPFEKARIANESGADFFISFHRNSSPRANQYEGAEVLLYNKRGIKYKMAQNILGALGEVGFREIGISERPGLVVLRRTKMPALLLEVGFINSDKDNQLYDQRMEEIANAIAEAILGTLMGENDSDHNPGNSNPGNPNPGNPNPGDCPNQIYYRVQIGAFRNRENADRLLYELTDADYPAFILYSDDFYKVQVGAFREIGNAINMEQRLRQAGYSTLIVTR